MAGHGWIIDCESDGEADTQMRIEYNEETITKPNKTETSNMPPTSAELTSMFFLTGIGAKRSNLTCETFAMVWTPEMARNNLQWAGAKQTVAHTSVEFLSCKDGDPALAPLGKLYLDKDEYVGTEPLSAEEVMQCDEGVRFNAQMFIDKLQCMGIHITRKITTRHGWCPAHKQNKRSYRPFFQGFAIRYPDIPFVIRWLKQEDLWDMSVYKPGEQLLATIGGCKGWLHGVDDQRVLVPESPLDDPLDYVVQSVDPAWQLLDIPQPTKADNVKMVCGSANDSATECTLFVKDMIMCLSAATSDDQGKWSRIGFALKGTSNANDKISPEFVEISSMSAKFKGSHDCKKFWDSAKPNRNGLKTGMGTICHFARLDDPVGAKAAWARLDKRAKVDTAHASEQICSAPIRTSQQVACDGEVLWIMQSQRPDIFGGLNANNFRVESSNNDSKQLVLYDGETKYATITYPDCSITMQGDNNHVCYLAEKPTIIKMGEFNNFTSDDTAFSMSRTVCDLQDVTTMNGCDVNSGSVKMVVCHASSKEKINPQVKIAGKVIKVTPQAAQRLYHQIALRAAKHVTEAIWAATNTMFNNCNFNTQINFGGGGRRKC